MTDETENIWEDLILAILSVNQYSLEKTYSAVEALRREGMFRPQNLLRWTAEEIGTRLRLGGYDRGDFMTRLFAGRLASLGTFVKFTGVEECERVLRKGSSAEVKQLLTPVKGIGPTVLANFFLLRDSTGSSSKSN
jgi:hypothetical protein